MFQIYSKTFNFFSTHQPLSHMYSLPSYCCCPPPPPDKRIRYIHTGALSFSPVKRTLSFSPVRKPFSPQILVIRQTQYRVWLKLTQSFLATSPVPHSSGINFGYTIFISLRLSYISSRFLFVSVSYIQLNYHVHSLWMVIQQGHQWFKLDTLFNENCRRWSIDLLQELSWRKLWLFVWCACMMVEGTGGRKKWIWTREKTLF